MTSSRAKSFYLIALAAALAALAWTGVDQDNKLNVAAASAPREAGATPVVANFLSGIQNDLSKRTAPPATPGKDPFSARSWEPLKETANKPLLPATPATPQAPPLPFVYKGNLTTDGASIVVLARPDRDYVVRAGDTLDGTYRVESIDGQRLVLKYLPLGIQQTLLLAAPGAPAGNFPPQFSPPGAPASGVPPAPGRSLPGPVLVPEHPDPALKEED